MTEAVNMRKLNLIIGNKLETRSAACTTHVILPANLIRGSIYKQSYPDSMGKYVKDVIRCIPHFNHNLILYLSVILNGKSYYIL